VGAIPPLPPGASMACSGTALLLLLTNNISLENCNSLLALKYISCLVTGIAEFKVEYRRSRGIKAYHVVTAELISFDL
jgi:hypothetical protein